MKIAQVTPVYPPYRGGMGQVAYNYAEMAKKLGAEIEVFSVDSYKPWLRKGLGGLMPLLIFKLKNFNIIHLHYPFFGADIFAVLAAKFFRIKIITTFHMVVDQKGIIGSIIRLYRRVFEQWILRNSSTVLVSSLDYAKSLSLQGENIMEVPFRVSVEKFSPASSSVSRGELGISELATVFIFVGGLDDAHYFKGLSFLLQAFARVNGNIHLIVVGSGNNEQSFMKQAQKLRVDDKIYFAGNVSETVDYYRLSDVHVFPSVARNEAFGLVTIEAGACGLPSIVSNLPGVRSVIIPDKTGWLASPGIVESLKEKMQFAVDNPEIVKSFGKAARERVLHNYNDQNFAQELQDIYGLVK
jgi:glycosyltransferase involved in cell wall biosynthesis